MKPTLILSILPSFILAANHGQPAQMQFQPCVDIANRGVEYLNQVLDCSKEPERDIFIRFCTHIAHIPVSFGHVIALCDARAQLSPNMHSCCVASYYAGEQLRRQHAQH